MATNPPACGRGVNWPSPPLTIVAGLLLLAAGFLENPLFLSIAAVTILFLIAVLEVPGCAFGPLSLFPLFVLGGALYILPTAITIAFSGVITDERQIPEAALILAVWVAGLALLFVVTGYVGFLKCVGRVRLRDPQLSRRVPGSALQIGLILIGAGTAALAYFVFEAAGLVALTEATYGGRYLLMEGRGLLLGCIPLVGLGGLILYVVSLQRGSPKMSAVAILLPAAVLASWTSITGSRSALVHFIIAVFAVRHISGKRVRLITLGLFGAILVSAVILHGVAGRSFLLESPGDLRELQFFNLNPANTELGSGLGTIADIVGAVPDREAYRLGKTYLQIPLILIPRAVQPERPMSPGEWYSFTFYYDVWAKGGAFAFSPVAEAYLNFGLAGVALVFTIFGIGLAMLERVFARRRQLSLWGTVAYATAVPYLLIFSRLDGASFVKSYGLQTLGSLLLAALVVWCVRELANELGDPAPKKGVQSGERPIGPSDSQPACP